MKPLASMFAVLLCAGFGSIQMPSSGGGGGACADIWTPSEDGTYVASDAITVTSGIQYVAGNAEAQVLTSTPSIVDGTDGTVVIIIGTSATDTLQLQDQSNLAGSGLNLAGGVDITLGLGDAIMLAYDADGDVWNELSRSDN